MPHTWYQLQAAAINLIIMYSFLFKYSSMLERWHLKLLSPNLIVGEVREGQKTDAVCGHIPLYGGIALAKSMNLSASSYCLKPRAANHFLSAMSLSPAYAAQCCARTIRASSRTSATAALATTQSYRNRRTSLRRWESTAAAPSSTNPKISTIVEQISQLTLLETADLVSNLKVSLHVCWIRNLAIHWRSFTSSIVIIVLSLVLYSPDLIFLICPWVISPLDLLPRQQRQRQSRKKQPHPQPKRRHFLPSRLNHLMQQPSQRSSKKLRVCWA